MSLGCFYHHKDKVRYDAFLNNGMFAGEWQFGFGLTDAGVKVKGFDLPTGAYINYGKWFNKKVFWTAELISYLDQTSAAKTGFEFNVYDTVFIRTGYCHQMQDQQLGAVPDVNVTAGLGIKINNIILDYAWLPQGDLGQTHRIALTVRFKSLTTARKRELWQR